jgi:hypothetical protein
MKHQNKFFLCAVQLQCDYLCYYSTVPEVNIRVNKVCNIEKTAFGKYVFLMEYIFQARSSCRKLSRHVGHLSPSHSEYDSVIPMCAQHYGMFLFKTDGTNL